MVNTVKIKTFIKTNIYNTELFKTNLQFRLTNNYVHSP